MLVMLQRHKRGRLITLVLVSVGFLASLSGGVITSKPSYSALVFSCPRPTSAAFSIQSTGKKTGGGREGRGGTEGVCLLTAVKQRKTGVDRETERGKISDSLVYVAQEASTSRIKYHSVRSR